MRKRFGSVWILALVCVMLSAVALSETEVSEQSRLRISSDLAELSVEELLTLRDEIDAMLEAKGYIVCFDIERGDKGEAVAAIQERLFELGFYFGKITGKYDSETQKAFKAFEKANAIDDDGLASREDQVILFGKSVVAKHVPESEDDKTVDVKQSATPIVEHDVSFDYEQCLRFPETFVGVEYKLKGKVVQTIGNRTNGFQIRFAVLGREEEVIYVFINDDPGYNILEGDWLIVDMIMNSTVTYESIWGQEITIPAAIAENVVLR